MSSVNESIIQGDVKARIDRWVSHYPADQKQSAVMPALRIVQEVNGGHLTTELMDQVADYLDMTPIASMRSRLSIPCMSTSQSVSIRFVCVPISLVCCAAAMRFSSIWRKS